MAILLEKNGSPITCLDDWHALAPPKSSGQWKPGRSAQETARAWCANGAPAMPPDLVALLDSHDATRGFTFERGTPEHRIPFDDHGGEPRNADLAFVGRAAGGKIAVTVEAKADEPFGGTVTDTLDQALERLIANENSRGVRRVEDLVRRIVPARQKGLPTVGSLRYQLLTAVAGTLAYAETEQADLALLLIHEFVTDATTDDRHAENDADLRRFLHRLSGKPADGPLGIVGPFAIGNERPLLIGKLTTRIRTLA